MSKYENGNYETGKNAAQDTKSEKMMNCFLVNKVYPEFVKAGLATSIESVSEDTLQKAGVDAIWFTEDGEKIYVDNKNRASALNQTSRAVPFELITNERDGTDRHYGWLSQLSRELFEGSIHLTDYILFIHPFSKDRSQKDFNEIKYEDIKELDILMVRVDEVFEYLSRYYKLSFKDISKITWDFDKEFMDKTEGMSDEDLKYVSRKCTNGFERGIRTALNKDGESYETYDAVIHTRHFNYSIYKGLSEFFDIKERRAFSKRSEDN